MDAEPGAQALVRYGPGLRQAGLSVSGALLPRLMQGDCSMWVLLDGLRPWEAPLKALSLVSAKVGEAEWTEAPTGNPH